MHTPDRNPSGYHNATISDMASLEKNVRFLIMHGSGDDNVHFQNTLVLLDKLDVADVKNYDVHVFPDSAHSIQFHNAFTMVYQREFLALSRSTFSINAMFRLTDEWQDWKTGLSMHSTANGSASWILFLMTRFGPRLSGLCHYYMLTDWSTCVPSALV